MRKVPKFVWTILACLLCVVVTAGVCLLTADRGASSDKYLEIIKIIGENYYGEQDVAKLEDASADAMLASHPERLSPVQDAMSPEARTLWFRLIPSLADGRITPEELWRQVFALHPFQRQE